MQMVQHISKGLGSSGILTQKEIKSSLIVFLLLRHTQGFPVILAMMRSSILLLAPFAGLASSQRVGTLVSERHPPLRWFRCIADGSCQPVDGELVLDANWRWLHEVSGTRSCYEGNSWNSDVCRTSQACTANCALEGAQYREYGIIAPATASDNTSVIQRLRTNLDSRYNKGSRMFLLESRDRYQTFTLLDHELAFDVDLSTVECGINAALKFVPMDADGGQARDKGNEAGAAYGTGYCDASCPRDLHFVPERGANVEQWTPSNTDLNGGQGYWGSCCPQMSVWNSNVHSFSVSTHTCAYPGREEQGPWICEGQAGCDPFYIDPQERGRLSCDYFGCSFNPYRMGNPWFYGKGKRLDTTRKFTYVIPLSGAPGAW
jgi:cellulose 1,4-beta-cellobiosidase